MKKTSLIAAIAGVWAGAALAEPPAPSEVVFTDGAIAESLTGAPGDPAKGRIVMDKGDGNCIACHQVSDLADLLFPGEIGPSLDGVASRWDESQLRGIVTNAKMMFPDTMMPSFYKDSGYIRPGDGYTGKAPKEALKPLLSAEQIEDVVAYLLTLKE